MKVTIETEYSSAEAEWPAALDIHDAVQLCRQALLGVGFHPDTVASALPEEE